MNDVQPSPVSYRGWIALIAIVLLSLALRLARLTFQPLWADEGYSVYFASLDPLALSAATAADIHPPLYYYLLKLWMAVFGPGLVSVRMLSVIFGVATVAAVYALASHLLGQRVALLSALLLAVSPFHIYYSQEVRMYALVGFLGTLSTLFMVYSLEAQDASVGARRRYAASALYVVTMALALYTLYYAVFLLVAQVVYVLVVYRRRWRMVAFWLALQTAVLLLYLPWLLVAIDALSTYVAGKVAIEQYAPLGPLSFVVQILAALGIGVPSAGRWFLSLGAVPLVAAAVLGAVRGRDKSSDLPGPQLSARLLLVYLVVIPLTMGYVVNVLWPFSPAGFQRLFLYCQPFFFILAAAGLTWLAERLASRKTLSLYRRSVPVPLVALIAILCFAALVVATLADFYLSPRYTRHDYRPLVGEMQKLAHPDDVVIALYPWQLGFIRSYYIGDLPRLVFVERRAAWADYPAVMRQDLDQMGQQHRRLWFPSYEAAGGLLEHAVIGYLNEAAYAALGQWHGDHRLYLYVWGEVGPTQSKTVAVGEALVLDSIQTSLEPLEAGRGSARINIHWLATGVPPAQAQVALRLIDDEQRTWARRDSPPHNGALPFDRWLQGTDVFDRHAIPIPTTTPPGSYRLLLAVYDRTAGRNLALSDTSGQGLGNELEIGKVVVTRSSYHPPVAALGVAHVSAARFVNGPRLMGYDLPATPLRPGHAVSLDLYWQVEETMTDDLILFVQARDGANKIWGLYEGTAVAAGYPPSRWVPGEVLRGQVSFLLVADAPAGEYRIVVGWLKSGSKERLMVVGDGDEVVLSSVKVVTRPHAMILPRPARPMDVRVGEAVQFLGFDGADVAKPGESLALTLYWRAIGRMDVVYSVFVHMVDEQGRVWAQQDSEPGGGTLPTTSWLPGEVITDNYLLALPAGMPPGEYTLLAGLYDKRTGMRLSTTQTAAHGTANAMTLGRVVVR